MGDAGRLDCAIGGLRQSKMRCGLSVAVRVGAIEKCMARRRAAAEGSMWSLSYSGVWLYSVWPRFGGACMKSVGIREAKAHFAELVRAAANGERS